MATDSTAALVDRLAVFERVVEVGIGHRTDVAAELAERGVTVTATDVHPRDVPGAIHFVQDDVTAPTPSVYADVGAVYALNQPPELHQPTAAVARRAGAQFLFTTLGGDQPAIPVTRETIPGDTVFVASDGPGR
ncbi:UPF0146 family protein [Haloarchaeobius sp. DFWS5]|uniref:UPF0146 family protein n=1 Tax=Haloarchaeobius sp. DFWS5 TaxID=3446114 RepID=UPI003EB80AF9